MMDHGLQIYFDPLLPPLWLWALVLPAILLGAIALVAGGRATFFRLGVIAAFVLVLLNPSLLDEKREPIPDVAVVVIDQSFSQTIGERQEQTAAALAHIRDRFAQLEGVELRILEAPETGTLSQDTRLFAEIDALLSDVPTQRRAGVIIVSDGQIHDVPQNEARTDQYGPVYVLLTGEPDETDRQLVVLEAPSYGIVGNTIKLRYKIVDHGAIQDQPARLILGQPGQGQKMFDVPVGSEQSLELPIEHAGQNIFELTVNTVPGEISPRNNKVAVIVNGVRDRLRVLLVSGHPHMGERSWRNLLTSDPSVDLVHFTILREPDKLDATPQDELSLIPFPFRELFEIKLYDFDLIIFDRYRLNRILPINYFNNIVRYVQEGGALLEASGPSFASQNSIFYTGLQTVLPGVPSGEVSQAPYKPVLTQNGRQHPVTRALVEAAVNVDDPQWGRWLRHIKVSPKSGETLINGAGDAPLLMLDRVGEGRVAQIASDHIWLWARGYDGGGPHGELLRRVVHWLMKEPELDERALDIQIHDKTVTVRRRDYGNVSADVVMRKPSGLVESFTLEPADDGFLSFTATLDELGVYSFEQQSGERRFAMVGDISPPELGTLISSAAPLRAFISNTGGQIMRLFDNPQPRIQTSAWDINSSRGNVITLRQNNQYNVTGTSERNLIAPWLAALLLLSLTVLLWWREGQQS